MSSPTTIKLNNTLKIGIGLALVAAGFILLLLVSGGTVARTSAAYGTPVSAMPGWLNTLWIALGGTGTFSIASLVTVIFGLIRQFRGVASPPSPGKDLALPFPISIDRDPNALDLGDFVELAAAFSDVVKNGNRAAQRRFVFAVSDLAPVIPGLATKHENNVLTITYTGFVDPLPEPQPAPPVAARR